MEGDSLAHIMRVSEQIIALESFQRLVDTFGKDTTIQTSIYQRVQSDTRILSELLYSMSQHVSHTDVHKGKVWIPNTIITRCFLDGYPNISNLCPRIWTVFEWMFHLVDHVAAKLPIFFLKVLNRFFRSSKIDLQNNRILPKCNESDLQYFEVAYFPHQGVFYSNLFLKDHFYSSEKDSPFYYEKICHFEINGNENLSSRCLEYYRTKNIKNYGWKAMPFNKIAAINVVIKFVGKALRHRFSGLDIDLLIKQAFIVWSVQTSMLRLQNLPNLKIVLIGYDILFPQTLSFACRLVGIKTIAVQERMIAAWRMAPMLVDYYFAIGPEARNCLKLNAPAGTSFYDLGWVRLKDHAKARIPPVISTIRKKYSWIVLAMDFHSEVGWFENGRCVVNNWRSNMIFYDHLLKLCSDFPNVFFLLKGKNTDFTKILFFKERAGQFRAQPNLLILEDQELWTPFSSVAAADIAVARHTSLAGEMLALGKPVIFDDYDGFPSKIYDYGQDVIAYDYEDIKGKLTRFFSDPEKYNANLNGLRKKLFSVPAEPVEQYLHKELMNIWNTINAT